MSGFDRERMVQLAEYELQEYLDGLDPEVGWIDAGKAARRMLAVSLRYLADARAGDFSTAPELHLLAKDVETGGPT